MTVAETSRIRIEETKPPPSSSSKRMFTKAAGIASVVGGLCIRLLCACCVLSGDVQPHRGGPPPRPRRRCDDCRRPIGDPRSVRCDACKKVLGNVDEPSIPGMRNTGGKSGVHPSAYGRAFVDFEGSYRRKDSEAAAAAATKRL